MAIFVCDGLIGLPDAVTNVFPGARHQTCWIHLQRNARHKVRTSDKAPVADELKRIYGADSREQAEERMGAFCQTWSRKYPKLAEQFTGKTNLFSFFDFPQSIQKLLFSNNMPESLNRRVKRIVKSNEPFPNEDALERTVCISCLEYKVKNEERRHHSFSKAYYELMQLFK